MQPSTTTRKHESSVGSGLWKRWRGYLARWLLFGGIVGMFQPIEDDLDNFGLQKLYQTLFGLFFGAVCAVVFTLAENTLNVQRTKWKSWLIVISTWLAVKLVFIGAMAVAGESRP